VANKVKDAVVVITGGTGSFGSTMTKYLLNRNVQEIRVFSRDEAKQEAMRHEVSDSRVTFVIGDVRDSDSVLRAVSGADLVFHAAAM
jgi:UDP-glucose 4-epimerase